MIKSVAKYQIQKVLGEGGMGKVYLARHSETGVLAAIKELHPEAAMADQYRLRFQREGEVLARLNHPGVVQFYDFKIIDGALFLIMEYAHGVSLSKHILNSTGPLSVEKTQQLMLKILDTFAYAHTAGVIHRDVKPDNIIVTPDLNIKILDFGIAKIKNGKGLTTGGTVMGTPSYMSPEQVRGRQVDQRSDIYSIGVLMHFLATGQPPYNEREISVFDINQKTLREPLPRANTIYPAVPDYIQELIDKATQKDPDQRFQTCVDFKAAFIRNSNPGANNNHWVEPEKHSQIINHNPQLMNTITIGRDQSCDIIINDNSGNVSRRHAEISVSGGSYVFRDVSTNGSLVNGQRILHNKILIQPGAQILLAGIIPVPWDKIMARLPISGTVVAEAVKKTEIQQSYQQKNSAPQPEAPVKNPYYPPSKPDKLGIGWGILAFLIPLAGFIMYFSWKAETPNRANTAGGLGLLSMALNLILIFVE